MTKVLVTGGAGTIGRAVVKRLLRDGAYEVRIADQRTPPAWMDGQVEVAAGDLRDQAQADAAAAGCSHVIHLAAIVGGIGNFHKLPLTLTDMNAALYTTTIGAALKADVERYTYVSSSMVFENATEYPTTEEHIATCPVPTSAYGFSKLAGEVWVRAAREEHGLRYTICRPFNAYGPGEMPEDEPGIAHMVPDVIKKVLAGLDPLPIFGSGEQTRTITHTDDIADGIVTATFHPAAEGEAFNISAADEMTVKEIAAVIWEQCGKDPAALEFEHLPTFAVDVVRRWPSVEKARRVLGWEAQIGVEQGIADTVAWLRQELPAAQA